MDKNKKLTIALILLICVSIFVWVPNFKFFNPKKQVYSLKEFSDKAESLSLSPILGTKKPFQNNYKNWGKNPFVLEEDLDIKKRIVSIKKELSEEDLASGFILEGIFWNEERPSALINNQLFQKGTKINENIVLEIMPDQVILNNGTRDFILKIKR